MGIGAISLGAPAAYKEIKRGSHIQSAKTKEKAVARDERTLYKEGE